MINSSHVNDWRVVEWDEQSSSSIVFLVFSPDGKSYVAVTEDLTQFAVTDINEAKVSDSTFTTIVCAVRHYTFQRAYFSRR